MITRIGSSFIQNLQPAEEPVQPDNQVPPAPPAEPPQPAPAAKPISGGPNAFAARMSFDPSALLQSTLLGRLKDGMKFEPAPPTNLNEVVIQGTNEPAPASDLAVRLQHQNFIAADPVIDLDRPPFDMVQGRLRNPLFVKDGIDAHEVDMNDVGQGTIGNCYVLASIAAVAKQNPEMIKNMIRDNDDGTYTVTFKYAGQDVPITVTADFPGGLMGSNHAKPGDTAAYGKKEVWPMIIEKAYAEYMGGYANTARGGYPENVLTALTGIPTSKLNPFASGFGPGTAFDTSFESLKRDLDSGRPIVFGTGPIKKDGEEVKGPQDEMYGLVGKHAYTLNKLYTDEKGQQWVELYNPWGYAHPKPIPYDQAKHMLGIYVNGRI